MSFLNHLLENRIQRIQSETETNLTRSTQLIDWYGTLRSNSEIRRLKTRENGFARYPLATSWRNCITIQTSGTAYRTQSNHLKQRDAEVWNWDMQRQDAEVWNRDIVEHEHDRNTHRAFSYFNNFSPSSARLQWMSWSVDTCSFRVISFLAKCRRSLFIVSWENRTD